MQKGYLKIENEVAFFCIFKQEHLLNIPN